VAISYSETFYKVWSKSIALTQKSKPLLMAI
jgi:hypothetical protein